MMHLVGSSEVVYRWEILLYATRRFTSALGDVSGAPSGARLDSSHKACVDALNKFRVALDARTIAWKGEVAERRRYRVRSLMYGVVSNVRLHLEHR